MTNGIFRVVLAAAMVSMFAASAVLGAEAKPKPEPKPEPVPVTVVGTVSVVKDANEVITAVKLTTEAEEVYNVVLDKEGLKLADMDGKMAEVTGEVTKKGEESWIKVISSKPVEKPKEEKPA
jgi:hypothetical protein